MTVLQIGDLHLGASYGAFPKEHAAQLKKHAWQFFSELVSYIENEAIDILLICGDLFDRAGIDIEWFYLVETTFAALLEKDILVVYATGNHDYFVTSATFPTLRHQPKFILFSGSAVRSYRLVHRSVSLVIHGVGYSEAHPATRPIEQMTRQGDASYEIAIYHGVISGHFNANKSPYYQTSLEELRAKNFDVVAIGHLHEVLTLPDHIFYSGCLWPSRLSDLGEKYGLIYSLQSPERTLQKRQISDYSIAQRQLRVTIGARHSYRAELLEQLRADAAKATTSLMRYHLLLEGTVQLSGSQKLELCQMLGRLVDGVIIDAIDVQSTGHTLPDKAYTYLQRAEQYSFDQLSNQRSAYFDLTKMQRQDSAARRALIEQLAAYFSEENRCT